MVAAVALFAVGAVVGAAKPNMLSSIMSDGFAMGDQMKITNSMMVGLGNAAWGGASEWAVERGGKRDGGDPASLRKGHARFTLE